MCNVANTRLLKNFCGQYFGRYNAVWSIFGRYLVNFVLVDIYYNPTGRSDGVEIGREEDVADPQ